MDSGSRRKEILRTISREQVPVSASVLAKKLEVSRQIIVGDVALLRAQGHEIIATARGYTMISRGGGEHQYMGKIACQHTAKNAKSELYAIVDSGAVAVNVIIDHEWYGEITGNLNLKTRGDVDSFMSRLKSSEVKLLSELTHGVHLHTIACRDKTHFEQVVQALDSGGVLFHG